VGPRAGLGFLEKTLVSRAYITLHRPTRGLDTVQSTLPFFFSINISAFNAHPTDNYRLPSCDSNKVAQI
jgi:hypothetical protein